MLNSLCRTASALCDDMSMYSARPAEGVPCLVLCHYSANFFYGNVFSGKNTAFITADVDVVPQAKGMRTRHGRNMEHGLACAIFYNAAQSCRMKPSLKFWKYCVPIRLLWMCSARTGRDWRCLRLPPSELALMPSPQSEEKPT